MKGCFVFFFVVQTKTCLFFFSLLQLFLSFFESAEEASEKQFWNSFCFLELFTAAWQGFYHDLSIRSDVKILTNQLGTKVSSRLISMEKIRNGLYFLG